MEMQIPSFPLAISFLLFILMVLNILKKYKHHNSNPPPGPWKFPLIGNFPQLMGGQPHHRLTDLAKKYGPVMSIQLGQLPTVIISSAEIAKQVLKTQDVIFADRTPQLASKLVLYDGMDIIYGPYGDHWRQLRKICTLELLSARRVQSFRSVREEEVSNFMRFLRSNAGSPVNLTKSLLALTNSMITVTSLGKKFKNQQAVLRVIDEVVQAAGGFSFADVFPSFKFLHYITGQNYKLRKIHREADRILEDLINEQRAISKDQHGEADNLLGVLLNLQENGDLQVPLTNDSIKAAILEMVSGGTDTSSKTTEWAMAEMISNPKALKKAQEEVRGVFGEVGKVEESRLQELKYLKMVIKEAMRLRPAGALLPRECREKTKVEGYDIYPKTNVLINLYAIQRDPSVWNEPEKFLPERFEDNSIDFKGTNFELIPFGAGKRICPGMTLAVINVELFLANLLYHFDWTLPDGVATLDMTEAFKSSLRRKSDLNLVPIPFTDPLPTK